jgi:pyruvate/2-oxoglutarate dehydrogenase complex dihydrolipoamide dehydrogenase (E3) component
MWQDERQSSSVEKRGVRHQDSCRIGHSTEPTAAVDLVVLGSGVGGLTAALTAVLERLSVIVVEHAEWIGGTSARSSGTVWVPGNHFLRAHGVAGDGEDAAGYLASLVGERGDETMWRAFLASHRQDEETSAVSIMAGTDRG